MFKEGSQKFEISPRSEFLDDLNSIIDKTREKVANIVNESRMPSKNYKSTVGIYGGRII